MTATKKIVCLATLTMVCVLCAFSQEKNSVSQTVTFGVQRSGKVAALQGKQSSHQQKVTIAETAAARHQTVVTGQTEASRVTNVLVSSGSSLQIPPQQSAMSSSSKKRTVVTVTE
jgi:hypothetical protein